jgi:conflict system STAND superfamily ATPase/uncharacterized protein DUF4062
VPELSTEVRIFLSSTFIDLSEIRLQVANRLREVFGAHLLVMETFGSDDAPPEISSVRRVRESDVFVGIYARRYGTVDQKTGKSITELELDEAERSLSAGHLVGILPYILSDEADRMSTPSDATTATSARLSALKERVRQHTYTEFRDPADLPFLVIRDVLAKIRGRLSQSPQRLREISLPGDRTLQRPIGMEFLTSADRHHLYGREGIIREVMHRIDVNQVTLLLGNSGTGKTSLIHAGLFPIAIDNGWFPVYTRPLGIPRTDIVTGLLTSVFEGPTSYRGTLIAPLEQAVAAMGSLRLLLIIDQFEDILTAREQEEAERLVADIRTIRYLDNERIRVLVSYRADLEARLGRYWQLISGSPQGLPRVYVGGISADDAWKSVHSTCQDLKITLALSDTERAQIRDDLVSFSRSHGEQGVYPPYIQMFIDHVWRKANLSGTYTLEDYVASSRMDGVTAGYLTRQLSYADDTDGHLKAALVSLVRSYGIKAQKSLAEVAADMGLAEKYCENYLETLIDLRLVRHIGNLYEVAHDFLAREISAKLVDTEEREFKRVRELLGSKAATFTTTRSLLTVEELLMLFKYKERVLISDEEVKLLVASWARSHGPGLSLLLGAPPARLAEIVNTEEGDEDIDREDKAMLALLRCKAGQSALRENDWALFRRYRLRVELAAMLAAAPMQCPDPVILWALRSKHRSVREAALESVVAKINSGAEGWISTLARSSSPFYRTAYQRLCMMGISVIFQTDSSAKTPRLLKEFGLLRRIVRTQSDSELWDNLSALKRFRPRAHTLLLANAISARRRAGLGAIVKKLRRVGVDVMQTLVNSVGSDISSEEFHALVSAYLEWNKKEAQHIGRKNRRLFRIYEDKASILAMAILRLATKLNLECLRVSLEEVVLEPSAQYYVLALMRVGDSNDILNIVNRVARAEYDIRYWFQIEMGHAVERRMTEIGAPVPMELFEVAKKKGFWDPHAERSKFSREDLLPLKNADNRALYLRVVAHALIGAAGLDNINLLAELAQHKYKMIASAAAIRLARVAGDVGIKTLQLAVSAAIERGNAESFGVAVRDAEIARFGLFELPLE